MPALHPLLLMRHRKEAEQLAAIYFILTYRLFRGKVRVDDAQGGAMATPSPRGAGR